MTKRAVQNRVPHVFNIVSDPIRSDLIDSYENAGWNRAGLAISSTIVQQVDLVESFGLLQNVGFVFNPREENSRDDWTIAEQEITQRGGNAVFMRLNAEGPIADQVESCFGRHEALSAIMLPSGSLIVSRGDELLVELQKMNVPVFAASPQLMRGGAIAGLTSNYSERGASAAKLVLAILEKGSAYDVDSLPMIPTLLVNQDALAAHDLTVPADIPYSLEYSN